jgi:hypothetical protein
MVVFYLSWQSQVDCIRSDLRHHPGKAGIGMLKASLAILI